MDTPLNDEYHHEPHLINRTGWLRAAVLGANDGIISTTSLVLGVASAAASQEDIALAGVAGLVAGAMSMAAGEYVSVSSQVDLEQADLKREQRELEVMPEHELKELATIYEKRGLTPELAHEVAVQLTAHDALGAHARDELGINEITTANPLEAAIASGFAFTGGAIVPILAVFFIPHDYFIGSASLLCFILLGVLGALAAVTGGTHPFKPAIRLMFWGAMAMGVSAIIGHLFGTVI